MNFKLNITNVCFSIGIAMLVLHFALSSTKLSESTDMAESINLALRQTAHHLYNIKKDSTSMIPPVEQIASNQFSLKLDKAINYDTLPFLLNQAFSDFSIPTNYEVTIKDCISNDILLGYNYLSFLNNETPCRGRDQFSDCTIIGLSFIDQKTGNYKYVIGSILFFLASLVSLILTKNINPKPHKTLQAGLPKVESIHLANSYFTPKNLTIKINNQVKTLTFRESKLLKYFFSNPNQVLQRDDIKHHVWGNEGVIVGRSVDVFVSRLRKILKEDQGLEIKNVHGVGYRLEVK